MLAIFKSNKNFENILYYECNNASLITISDIKNKLNIFDISIFHDYFLTQDRLLTPYLNNQIKSIDENNLLFKAQIVSNKVIETEVEFSKNDYKTIKRMSCTCPYYETLHKNCLHLYSLLYKLTCSDNLAIIKKEINRQLDYLEYLMKNNKQVDKKNLDIFKKKHINEDELNLLMHLQTIIKYRINLKNRL